MADKGEGTDPEIILLDDDDDPPIPAKEPTPANEPAKVEETSKKAAEEVEEVKKPETDAPVDPAESKGALEKEASTPATDPAPVKAEELMEVDDDSDLELIAEVPVKKPVPTEIKKGVPVETKDAPAETKDAPAETKKDALRETKKDLPAAKRMCLPSLKDLKDEAMKIDVEKTPDATIPFTFVSQNKDDAILISEDVKLTTITKVETVVSLEELAALNSSIKDEKPDIENVKKEGIKVHQQF
jgi:hypothetical protein